MSNPTIETPKRTMTYNQTSSCPDMEPAFLEIYEACREFTMTSLERMYALYKAVEHIERAGIAGDIVECGVWRGGSAMVCIMTLLQLNAQNRTIHLFDTFAGMTDPGDRDCDFRGDHASTRLTEQVPTFDQMGRVSIDEVRANLHATAYPNELLRFIKGRVEEMIPVNAPAKIALLHLDTDWYASTKHELMHLYPRITQGGVLLIDDYGHWRGAREAVDEYFQDIAPPILLNRVDYTGRIGVKP